MSGPIPSHGIVVKTLPESGATTRRAPSSRAVYCVPAAGTGARSFLVPFARSPLRTTLRVVQLPGREDRLAEPFIDDIRTIATLIADAIVSDNARDYALFGHSFGALVMLETARHLEQINAPEPALLAVAACAAPNRPLSLEFDEMEPREIVEALRDLGGLDFSGPGGEELAAIVVPALVADFRACNRYLRSAPSVHPVSCPILAMSGTSDPAVTTARMQAWRPYTSQRFETQEFDGGHFFPLESELPLREVIEWGRQ